MALSAEVKRRAKIKRLDRKGRERSPRGGCPVGKMVSVGNASWLEPSPLVQLMMMPWSEPSPLVWPVAQKPASLSLPGPLWLLFGKFSTLNSSTLPPYSVGVMIAITPTVSPPFGPSPVVQSDDEAAVVGLSSMLLYVW